MDRFRQPVERHVSQQFVPCKSPIEFTLAIGPVAKFFQYPCRQGGGRIVQTIGRSLRLRSLNVGVGSAFVVPMTCVLQKLLFNWGQLCFRFEMWPIRPWNIVQMNAKNSL